LRRGTRLPGSPRRQSVHGAESPGQRMFPDLHSESERLRAYAELVRRWAPRLDLVAPADLERFEPRHVSDSLRILALLDSLPPGPGVDVGSGAGLPGIPLAICRPDRRWRLVEPRRRRASFLEEAVRVLDLNCEVLVLTAEEAAAGPLREAHIVATARALTAPERAFELLLPLVGDGGVAVVFVGAGGRIPAISEEWDRGIAIIRRGGSDRLEEYGRPDR
jgi:16S rRNA (guanine527-N7)-methyltransferase